MAAAQMLTRRSTLDIVGEILRLEQAGKTQIMYQVNMSHVQVNRYLELLLERGLLEKVSGRTRNPRYATTDQGRQVLSHIDEVVRSLDINALA